MSRTFLVACSALVCLLLPVSARAQALDTLGSRAAALGAFVAVADDGSAVAWNPAGLATGPIFNFTFQLGRSANAPDLAGLDGTPGGRHEGMLFATTTLPLGISYYRLRTTTAVPSPAVGDAPDRQDRRVLVQTLQTHHVGATVLQSIGSHFALGATLKVVRGRVGGGALVVSSWDDVFERAGDLEASASTSGDIDLGAMFAAGAFRAGAVVRNLTTPRFGGEEREVTLDRHARLGVAWGDGWPGTPRRIVAVDADLTRVPHVDGDRRDLAAGLEQWFGGQRLGIRGGARVSTVGEARPIASAGASWQVRPGMHLDAHVAGGPRHDRAWTFGMRLTY